MAAKKKAKRAKKEPERRKAVRKDKGILIRVTETQKAALAEAAAKEALGVSSWMLAVAMREIERKANAAAKAAK
jgi:uncharacterized protein (DUF1778 family)